MNDHQQVLRLFDDGDRALMGARAAEMRRIYADDYVQHDEIGSLLGRILSTI
jgi:hypothetical protein